MLQGEIEVIIDGCRWLTIKRRRHIEVQIGLLEFVKRNRCRYEI